MGKANDRGHQERNRLYQKNFQRRKNDTDNLLNKRVELLETAIDDMHRRFLNFTDDLISSGALVAAPELLPGLKHVTAKFLSHARDVWPNDDDHTAPNTQTSITIQRPLGVSISYCHNESSFSRYLQRAALERGYNLLADPGVSRAEVCSAFRLTLFFLELKHIREGLFELLTRPTSTTMDYRNAPFTNLGQSGTHYPRSDILTQSGSFRPQLPRFKHPEEKSLAHELQDTDRLLNVADMEGEWFDNVDVE